MFYLSLPRRVAIALLLSVALTLLAFWAVR